jgi:hypothetical protein
VIKGNRFGSLVPPWRIDDPSAQVVGNVYDDTVEPIPYP